MSETKHTPGPWKAHGEGFIIRSHNTWPGLPICDIDDLRGMQGGLAQANANADLICAAPDLLEACEWIYGLDIFTDAPECQDAVEKALGKIRAAVAKARGEG